MGKKLFKNTPYNTPGHAHELIFSAHRKQNVFLDVRACELLLNELQAAREEFAFRLWAYVVMWSSAYARVKNEGLIPDRFNMPVARPAAQIQGTRGGGYSCHTIQGTSARQLGELGPLMRGTVVRIGTRNKQYYFSLNKAKKTRLIYLGDKRVDRARQYSDNYKPLLLIVEKMTILNMEVLKNSEY